MKKLAFFLLAALLIFTVVGCAKENTICEYTVNGKTYIIDTENWTIAHDSVVCKYLTMGASAGGNFAGGTLTVTYPDGSWYRTDIDSNGHAVLGTEVTSNNYSDKIYPRGGDLCYALENAVDLTGEEAKNSISWEDIESKLLLLGFFGIWGAFQLFFPETVCWLKHGRWVKDSEPTEEAIRVTRFGGVFLIIVGVIAAIFI